MKYIFVFPRLPYIGTSLIGGSANAGMNLARFAARSSSVDVISISNRSGADLKADNPNICFHIGRQFADGFLIRGIGSVLYSALTLWVLSRTRNYRGSTVIICSGTIAYGLVSVIGPRRFRYVQMLYCPAFVEGGAYSSWWERKSVLMWFANHIDYFLPATENIRESLKCIDSTKVSRPVLMAGKEPADVECRKLPSGDGALKVLFVGNVSEEKGVDILISAVEAAGKRGARLQLRVLLENASGVRKYHELLAGVSNSLESLQGVNVSIGGGVEDIVGEYCGADVIVFPWMSTRGPSDMPMAGIEAAQTGMRCIVSDVGGLAEFGELVGGDIFPAGNTEALADLLVRYAACPRLVRSERDDRRDIAAPFFPSNVWSCIARIIS